MTVRAYYSTDASAPVLDGVAGSLVGVLDACLVDGYGAKAAAGWTKEFSGTNQASYRNSPTLGTGYYLRVDDNGPGAGGGREARIWGYETMTSVSAGTNQFPDSGQSTFGRVVRKSNTASTSARAWVCVADERTCYLFVETSDSSGFPAYAFGDYEPIYGGVDAYRVLVIGRGVENSSSMSFTTNNSPFGYFSATLSTGGYYIARSLDGVTVSVEGGMHSHAANPGSGIGVSGEAYPHPIDGGIHLAQTNVHDSTNSLVRGTLRGIWTPRHSQPLTHLDTFDGSGTMAGKQFLAVNIVNIGQAIVEISDTWPT